MVAVTCVGCGRRRQLGDEYAGQRVVCVRCGAKTIVPAPDTVEVDVSAWFPAIDATAELETASVEVKILPPDQSR